MPKQNTEDQSAGARKERLLVEVLSEGPHCVPCQYTIAAVRQVEEFYEGQIEFKVLETKRIEDATRYFELCRLNGGTVPVPSILISGRLAFEQIPGTEDLRRALDEALLQQESGA